MLCDTQGKVKQEIDIQMPSESPSEDSTNGYSIEVSTPKCALCGLKQLACDRIGTSDWLMVM